jgi:hypothetical protein
MPASYPLDLSGNSPNNLITSELHSANESKYRDYAFIVPNCSPFYVDNLMVKHILNGVETILTEDVEYSLTLPYITATRTTGKPVYGAFTINDTTLSGILSFTYQTVGGNHVADRLYVLNYLIDKAYNPRTTIWDIITDVQDQFPPTPHYQDYDQFYGQEEVVGGLNHIKDAILTNSSNIVASLTTFFNGINPALGNNISRLGDTMLGPLVLKADPVLPLEASTKQYVDALAVSTTNGLNDKVAKVGDTMTGPLVLSGDPTNALHAVTKQYMDNIVGPLLLDPVTKTYVDSKFEELRGMIDEMLAKRSYK